MEEEIYQIEQIYKELTDNDFSFLSKYNIPETELPTLLVIYDFYKRNKSQTLEAFFQYRFGGNRPNFDLAELTIGLKNILCFFDTIELDPKYEPTMDLCATVYLKHYINKFVRDGYSLPQLPSNPIENSIFLDLVTGIDFINFYPNLSEQSEYWLIDKSKLAVKCLEIKKEQYPQQNIRIFKEKVETFNPPTLDKKIGLIRAKNVFCYIDNFKEYLGKYKDMLEPGGIFIFQENTQSKTISHPIYGDLDSFFSGWQKTTENGDQNNLLALDSIIYIKP